MSEREIETLDREEIQARRAAIAMQKMQINRDAKKFTARCDELLLALQERCNHFDVVMKYGISHFEKICGDCGKRIS